MHRTFGRIGSTSIASLEVIGYDALGKKYKSHYFGPDGSSLNSLFFEDGKWSWQSAALRGAGTFSADEKKFVTRHEKLNSKGKWIPAMEVTLQKVE